MSRFTTEAYEALIRNRQNPEQEQDTSFLLNAYNSMMSQNTDTPAGSENLAELDNIVQQETTPSSFIYKKKSLTELANDPEFQKRADRFLDGIGSNEEIFEYLRDANFSLSSAMVRSFQTGKWTDDQKEDYLYLQNAFNNAEVRGFKEKFNLVKNATGDILLDPLNIVTAIFAIPSGGTTVAGRAAIGEAARQGVKRLTKAKLKDKIASETAKSYALYGAAEGMAWSGLHNYFMQDMDVDLGVAQDIDYGTVLKAAGIGTAIGGGIGGGLGYGVGKYFGKDKFIDKEFKFVREDNIDYVGPTNRELELAKYEIDAVMHKLDDDQYEDIFFNINDDMPIYNRDGVPINPETGKPYAHVGKKLKEFGARRQHNLNFLLAKTIGKPTTEFLQIAERSETLQNFLRSLRYDYDVKLFSDSKRTIDKVRLNTGGESTRTYGEAIGNYFGKFHYGLAKAFNNLYRTGYRGKLLQEQNDNLLMLLRDENLGQRFSVEGKKALTVGKEYRGILIDEDIANAYTGVKTILDDIYDEASRLGLFKPNTKNKGGYFPRLFNYSSIEKDYGLGEGSKFKQLLINSGHADPTNAKQMFKVRGADGEEIIDEATGKPLLVSKLDDEGTDLDTFGRNFAKEAAKGRQVTKDGKKVDVDVEDLTPAELLQAQKLKADAIIEDMLQYKYVPFELRQKGKGDSNGYFQPRRFTNIKDDDMAEFLEGNVQDVLEQYTTNIAQSMARKKYFGATLGEFDNNIVQKIIAELGGGPEGNKIGNKVREIFKQVTGIEQYKNTLIGKSKFAQTLSDWGKLSQQMAHLPFATLSSITEPFILLSRVGTHEVPETIGNIAKALVSEGRNVIDRTLKSIKRIGTSDIKTVEQAQARGLQKGFRDLDDLQWQELYQTGLALEQSVQERIAGLAGEALHGSTFMGIFTVKEAQNAFFKSNLLTQWTKAVQLASFQTGKMMLRNRARDLARHADGTVKLSKARLKYYEGQLGELGIDSNAAINWYRRSIDSSGKFNPNLAKGLFTPKNKQEALLQANQQNFYKQNILGGANRFTKEVILNPSAAEANRPLWFSSPSGSLLTQFAGYPTVFNNTILKRFIRESVNYPMLVGTQKVLPTIMLMTAVAHVGNLIRSQGKSMQDYETGADLPTGRVIGDAVRRWGGYGPIDYVNRFAAEYSDRKAGNITASFKAISGPLGQDVIDSIAYRRGLAELAATNLPYQSFYDIIFGEGTRKELRQKARAIDKGSFISRDPFAERSPSTADIFASGPSRRRSNDNRIFYDRGGIVMNVPNVTDEPDERVDKMTGESYNNTSENAQDLADRELKRQMFKLGGAAIRDSLGSMLYPAWKKGADALGYNKDMQNQAFTDAVGYILEYDKKGQIEFNQASTERKDDIEEIVRHALLGYRVGDTLPKRAALQVKDATQAALYYGYNPETVGVNKFDFEAPKSGSGFKNERGDIVNNKVGFMLREKYGDDEQAAMEEVMRMIARNDDTLNYMHGSNINKDPFNPQGRVPMVFGGIVNALNRVATNLTRRVRPKKDIKAYHGTEADFDEFDTDFLLTGEGANAFGRGLYFTDTKALAQQYRASLAYDNRVEELENLVDEYKYEIADVLNQSNYHKKSVIPKYERLQKTIDNMGVEKFNKIKEEELADNARVSYLRDEKYDGPPIKMKEIMTPFEFEMHVPKYLKNRLNLKHNNYNAYINAEVDKLVDTFTFGRRYEVDDILNKYTDSEKKAILDIVNKVGPLTRDRNILQKGFNNALLSGPLKKSEVRKLSTAEPGTLYEVNIKASDKNLLLWDKPIGEQSNVVKNAVNASVNELEPEELGKIFRAITSDYFDEDLPEVLMSQRFIDEIGKMKYFDKDFEVGKKPYMNKPPKLIKGPAYDDTARLTKEMLFDMDGRSFIYYMKDVMSPEFQRRGKLFNKEGKYVYVEDFLKNYNVEGIKYLDGMSRKRGKGTFNYVVFNSDIIEISKKYGVTIPFAALIYNQFQNYEEDEI